MANLPVEDRAIEMFPKIWAKYDPKATTYIDILQLENLLEDLAINDDTKDLVMFPKKVADERDDDGDITKDNSVFRKRLIMALDIPTYEHFKKVMFHDVI